MREWVKKGQKGHGKIANVAKIAKIATANIKHRHLDKLDMVKIQNNIEQTWGERVIRVR